MKQKILELSSTLKSKSLANEFYYFTTIITQSVSKSFFHDAEQKFKRKIYHFSFETDNFISNSRKKLHFL